MRLLHVPFTFHPDPIGGTEVYVEALAREQNKLGHSVIIAAPGEQDAAYRHNGFAVRRFAVSAKVADLREMYGMGDLLAAAAFSRILDEGRPDIVHLHAFTRGVSLRLVREAKRRDIPVVFSYHTPTVSCQRGTLLRWGLQICDGALDLHGCARCTLHARGIAKTASAAIGSLPSATGRLLGNLGASGGLWTALRMTELVRLRHAALRALMNEVEHVVALCQWVKDLLLRNGVPAAKVSVSRQGLCQDHLCEERNCAREIDRLAGPLRVAFLGRLDPSKGVHVLIEALRRIPEARVRLEIYGVAQDEDGRRYRQRLSKLTSGDPRIAFRSPMPNGEVVARLREYDALAAPSQCLETGPIVVLEAFAAGIPVIGSNLGGIAELVADGIDGLLVEHASPQAWATALRSIAEDRAVIAKLRSGIRAPRTMKEGAAELMAVYSAVSREPVTVIGATE